MRRMGFWPHGAPAVLLAYLFLEQVRSRVRAL